MQLLLYPWQKTRLPLLGKIILFDKARACTFRRDALRAARKKGNTRPASQILWINSGCQWSDRCHTQITLWLCSSTFQWTPHGGKRGSLWLILLPFRPLPSYWVASPNLHVRIYAGLMLAFYATFGRCPYEVSSFLTEDEVGEWDEREEGVGETVGKGGRENCSPHIIRKGRINKKT